MLTNGYNNYYDAVLKPIDTCHHHIDTCSDKPDIVR